MGKTTPCLRSIVCLVLCLLLYSPVFDSGVLAQEQPAPFQVALTGKYPPFNYYGADGNLTGFDVDVAKAIAGELKRPCVFVATEWDGILAGLLTKKYDAIIGSMAITEERQKKALFTSPYYVSGAQLFVHKDLIGKLTSIDACKGQPIGVGLGETYEQYLRKHHSEIQILTYKGIPDIFQDMKNKRLVGFVTDRLVGQWQIRQAGCPYRAVGPLLYEERIGIPVHKDHAPLLKEIDTAIATLKASGTFDRLQAKYFAPKDDKAGPNMEPMEQSVIFWKLAKGFGTTLGVAVCSILLGFVSAIPLGLLLHRRRGAAALVARGVVDFLRGTPVLIQLFFIYFGAPQIGLTLSPIASAIITLSINAAAYMSEVVRSGLMSVDPGQALAGRALGLSKFQTFRFIIWPQAFRIALPPLMNSVVALTKDTALISVISVSEVVREAQSIIAVTFEPGRYYLIVACLFFAVTYPLMRLAGRLETRIREKGYNHA